MKKLLICIALFLTIGTKAEIDSTLTDCGELYFSEIMRSDVVVVGGTHYGDYVIEIFNPTSSPVNLDFYTVEMLQANGTVRNLDLNGWIAAKSTYLICYENAESTILALADLDTTLLDLGQCIRGRLIKHVTGGQYAVDVFGQTLVTSQAIFNYLLFMQDPDTYLNTYGVNIDDLQNLDIRRGMFVKHGVNPFVASDVFGTWAFYAGVDQSDLGNHYCLCNMVEGDQPICGYDIPLAVTLNKLPAYGSTGDPLNLYWSSIGGASWIITNTQSGGNVTSSDINFTGANTCSNAQININCVGIECSGFGSTFTGTKNTNIILSSPYNDFTVDAASKIKAITIKGNSTVGIKEYDYNLLPITIYPTVTSDNLNVKGNIDCKYSITSVEGKLMKEGDLFNSSTIDVSSLSNGIYTISFANYNGHKVDKFIKQ